MSNQHILHLQLHVDGLPLNSFEYYWLRSRKQLQYLETGPLVSFIYALLREFLAAFSINPI